ncbi:MAG: hypothetical protein ACE5GS_00125 [Kiloniellaceae bacterium]
MRSEHEAMGRTDERASGLDAARPRAACCRPERTRSRLAGLLGAAVVTVSLFLPAQRPAAEAVKLDLGLKAHSPFDAELLVGEWLTVIEENGYPQPVRLKIHQIQLGKTAGKMTFSSPRRCSLDLEYGGPHEGRHIFYIIPFTNCFEYEKTDFIAISQADDLAAVGRASEERADAFSFMRRAKKPEGQGPGSDPVNGTGSAPELDRIHYAISLGGAERESGTLFRQ